MDDMELLQSAVRKLGPERAQQTLRAFGDDPTYLFCGCALAHAYGNAMTADEFNHAPGTPKVPGTLMGDWLIRGTPMHELLGLSAAEFSAVSTAHCGWRAGTAHAIAVKLRSLLEAEAAKMQHRCVEPLSLDVTEDAEGRVHAKILA